MGHPGGQTEPEHQPSSPAPAFTRPPSYSDSRAQRRGSAEACIHRQDSRRVCFLPVLQALVIGEGVQEVGLMEDLT